MAEFDPIESDLSPDAGTGGGPGATVDAPVADAGGGRDDIDSLLSQFDRETTGKAAAQDAPAAASELPADPVSLDWSKVRAFSDSEMLGLAMQSDGLRIQMDNMLQRQAAQEHAAQEKADFAEVVEFGAEFLEGFPVRDAKSEVERWMLAEAALDPRLAEAWQHRRSDDPGIRRYAVRTIERSLKKMAQSIKSRLDPDLSSDRAMVSAAVRGASGKEPPARPLNYSKMSNSEFQQAKDQAMGD